MSFKAGDKCLVLPRSETPGMARMVGSEGFDGTIVTLISIDSYESFYRCNYWNVAETDDFVFGEVLLRKLDNPPPPSQELGSWDLCPWQPNKVTT